MHLNLRFFVAPVPGRMGYIAAVERWRVFFSNVFLWVATMSSENFCPYRFLKVMAMVWAGSQVTKLVRAGGWVAGTLGAPLKLRSYKLIS